MSEIECYFGVWRSSYVETCTKTCKENFERRIMSLSSSNNKKTFFNEWSYIIGEKNLNEYEITKNNELKVSVLSGGDLCLCGQKIQNIYYIINDVNKNITQVGSSCIERVNKQLIKKYKMSNKKKVECIVCNKICYNYENHKITEKHNNKKNQMNIKLINFFTLNRLNRRKCINNQCYRTIKIIEPEWKKECLNCYHKNKMLSI